jgi:hypothetical protein
MAVAMDALLNIKASVTGANGIVKLSNDMKKLDNGAKEAEKGFSGLTGSVSGLGKMLGAVGPLLSIAGIAALGANAIEAGDHIFDLAQKTGVSVEALAKFGKAAKLGGSDLDEVGKAMVKLSKGLAETAATGTGPAATALQQLGISATDSSGKLLSADKVMLQIADRFKQMPDGAEKTALALQLFGKSGADIIPVLNQGGKEIDAFSTKMTSAFAAKAATYDDNLKVLQGTVSGLGFAIAEAVLPALTNMTVWMTAVTKAVVTGFTSMKEPVGSALMMIAEGVQALTPWVAGIVGVIAVIKLAKAATDAWALSQKILLAFSGPKGWAMLALGIGIAALATNGLKKATDGTGAAMKQIREEIEAAKQQIQGQLGGFELMKDNATQAKDAQAQWKLYVDQTNASYAALQANVAAAKQSVDGSLQLVNAQVAAETAVNNAAKSLLQTKLDAAQTDAERLMLTQQIADIDIKNAKLQLAATNEQIASEVIQARLKVESARLDEAKAVAELASARARGMATDEYNRAVDAQALVVNAAIQEYEIAKMVATAKGKAADATYDQAIQQAKANVVALQQRQSTEKIADASRMAANNISAMPTSLERSADAANRLAGNMQDVADSSRQVGLLGAGGQTQISLGNFARPIGLPAFAEGGVVSRPTLAMVGEGGQAEYIIPASKMAAASANYLGGSRGASVLSGGGKGGVTPQINIQTGPIMQTADGQQWVTIGDLERAQRQTVAAVMGQLRTPAGRYAVGAR